VVYTVGVYIDHCVSELIEIQNDKGLQNRVRSEMRRKANGTFLWVSLVIKQLRDAMSWEVPQVIDEVPTDLKAVYRRMMDQIQRLKPRNIELCKRVLSTVTAAYRPLYLQELYVLSGSPT
jgi:hypothetical protein